MRWCSRHRRRIAVLFAVVCVTLCAVSPVLAAGDPYVDMLWAPWAKRPTDAEIEAARAKVAAIDSSSLGDGTSAAPEDSNDRAAMLESLQIVSAKAVKVHAVSGKGALSGEPETGNQVVAIVTNKAGNERLWVLYFNTISKKWEFGPASMKETENLDALYAAGYAKGWVEPGQAGGAPARVPWSTALGGLAAVAAAATALAGASASRLGKRGKVDPNETIGYVLRLSANRLDVSADQSAVLETAVYKVLGSGSYELASDATISLTGPPEIGVSPAQGGCELESSVWQTAELGGPVQLTVDASAPGGGTRQTLTLVPRSLTELVLIADKKTLSPNGRDVAIVEARLKSAEGATCDEAVRQSIAFAMPSATEWLNVGEAKDVTAGKNVAVTAYSPDRERQLEPPESVTVTATATDGELRLSASLVLQLERPPALDARPDTVEFAADSKQTAEAYVWVDHPGEAEWTFDAHWRDGHRPLASFEIERQTASAAIVRLTEQFAGSLPDSGYAEESSQLVVVAHGGDWDPLERYVKVLVTYDGVFIAPTGRDPDGTFHVDALGEGKATEIDVRVYARDAEGAVQLDPALSLDVSWEPADAEGTPGRAVFGMPEFRNEAAGMRPIEPASAIWRVSLARALPTGPEPLRANARVSVPGRDEPQFSRTVALTFLGIDTSPFSEAWQAEFDACTRIINEYVPAENQQKLRDLLRERGKTMGAEGLFEMRTRIWTIAHDALMKESADYLDKAWTYEQVENTLDWVSWCGDIALGVASGSFVGTVGAVAIGLLKPVLVSGMEAWVYGRSLEEWATGQLGILKGVVEGAATDVDLLAKLTGERKAAAWALFIAYYFVKELANDPDLSVVNAMKRVGAQLRDEGLVIFLRRVAGVKPAGSPAEPDAPATAKPKADAGAESPSAAKPKPSTPTGPSPQARAKAMAADIEAKTAGGKKLDQKTMMEIMTDPDAMRHLRKNNPAAWQKMHEARKQVYREHDKKLREWIKRNIPEAEGHDVVVESFGTKDGVDHDYRAGIVLTNPNTGQKRMIELPKEQWAPESQRIFAEQTGGPTDPKGAAKWSKDHQQLQTDGYHAEASVDMADQGRIFNERTGRWEQTQMTPNVDLVKRGESTLLDPDGLGRTYETKVAEAYHGGNPLDAYKQADKAVHSLEGCREGYAKQHYGVKELPPKVEAGMQAIKDVQSGALDPAGAEARLKKLGYSGGLPDFMEKVSGQFANLKFARKG